MTDDATLTSEDLDTTDTVAPDVAFDLTDGAFDDEEEVIDRPWLRPGSWYVVHSQSGYEKKVQQSMQARIQSMQIEDRIYEIVIPMEDVVEFKGGHQRVPLGLSQVDPLIGNRASI